MTDKTVTTPPLRSPEEWARLFLGERYELWSDETLKIIGLVVLVQKEAMHAAHR